jgi:hypothetical protein
VSGPKIISFHRYISTRKYHQGRGSNAGWAFIAHALGDPDLPEATSWQELHAYLLAKGAERGMIEAGRTVWRSYLSHLSKERRGDASNAFGQARAIAAGVG